MSQNPKKTCSLAYWTQVGIASHRKTVKKHWLDVVVRYTCFANSKNFLIYLLMTIFLALDWVLKCINEYIPIRNGFRYESACTVQDWKVWLGNEIQRNLLSCAYWNFLNVSFVTFASPFMLGCVYCWEGTALHSTVMESVLPLVVFFHYIWYFCISSSVLVFFIAI